MCRHCVVSHFVLIEFQRVDGSSSYDVYLTVVFFYAVAWILTLYSKNIYWMHP